MIGGAGGLAVSGGLALGSLVAQQRYRALDERDTADQSPEDLAAEAEQLRGRGNAMAAAAAGGAALSIGAAGVGATLWW